MAKNKNILVKLIFLEFSRIRSIIKVIDPDAPKHPAESVISVELIAGIARTFFIFVIWFTIPPIAIHGHAI